MAQVSSKKALAPAQRDQVLKTMRGRFQSNMHRHEGLEWEMVQARLEARPGKLWAVGEMERTGGEPDVVGLDEKTGEYLVYDCSAESPRGRRSVCYDEEARRGRKKHAPEDSAIEMATAMGAALLSEHEYRKLQALGEFDTKTSSWLLTPPSIRERGGAIFGDYRYGTVFIYHNGADSYYAARGFRCSVRV
jgi:hypothetical protein